VIAMNEDFEKRWLFYERWNKFSNDDFFFERTM